MHLAKAATPHVENAMLKGNFERIFAKKIGLKKDNL
jgi:hypothetical protein